MKQWEKVYALDVESKGTLAEIARHERNPQQQVLHPQVMPWHGHQVVVVVVVVVVMVVVVVVAIIGTCSLN